jgi:membrane associated rhomboid family serine protease
MVKARPPTTNPPSIKAKVGAGLITLVSITVVILLLVSCWTIITQYISIMMGALPTDLQKMSLDYSLSIFTGSAAFILLYRFKFEDIICELFGTKKVKYIKRKNSLEKLKDIKYIENNAQMYADASLPGINLGNLSLSIILACFISIVAYQAINIPNGGNVPENIYSAFGSTQKQYVGFVTNHFLHLNPDHLIANLIGAIVLLAFALALEKEIPRLNDLNLVYWIVFPIIFTSIIQTTIFTRINPDFRSIGMSIFDFYLLGFMLIVGSKNLEQMIVRSVLQYWNAITLKARLNIRNILNLIMLLLLVFVITIMLAELISGSNLIDCLKNGSDQVSCFKTFVSEVSHYIALIIGFAVGFIWKGKNKTQQIS